MTAALLWFVLSKVDLAELLALFTRGIARWPVLLFALALPALGLLIGAWRWRLLLEPQGYAPRVRTLYAAHLVGTFFNQFFPSTIGGDVARSWWIADPLGSRLLSITVVGVDRVIGLVGICGMAVIAAALAPSLASEIWEFWLALGIGVVIALVAVALASPAAGAAGRRLFSIPKLRALRDKAGIVYGTLKSYRDQRWRLFAAFLLSLALQLAIVVQYISVAWAMGISVSAWGLAIIIPIVTLVSLVPITINGVGLRENALVVLGGTFGLGAADAVALAWFIYSCTLVYGLLGGLTHVRGRRLRSAAAARGGDGESRPLTPLHSEQPSPGGEAGSRGSG